MAVAVFVIVVVAVVVVVVVIIMVVAVVVVVVVIIMVVAVVVVVVVFVVVVVVVVVVIVVIVVVVIVVVVLVVIVVVVVVVMSSPQRPLMFRGNCSRREKCSPCFDSKCLEGASEQKVSKLELDLFRGRRQPTYFSRYLLAENKVCRLKEARKLLLRFRLIGKAS